MADAFALPRAVALLRRRRHAWQALLVAAFGASVLGFCGAALYGELRLRRVDVRLDAIADEHVPAILSLTSVRTELRSLDSAIGHELHGGHATSVADAAKRIRAQWTSYATSVKADADESSAQTGDAVDEAVDALSSVDRLLQDARDDEARRRFDDEARTKVDRADSMLASLVAVRADEARTLAQRAEENRARTARTSLGVDALTVVCACLAAIMAMVALRRYGQRMETRAAELEAFAERVAHDIRGPLMPALLSIDIAEKRVTDDADMLRTLGRGRRSLHVVESIVNDLLAFARAGAVSSPDAHASVRRAINDVLCELDGSAAEARIDLNVEPFQDVAVACAPGVLASILGNLIRNAIVHMGDAQRRRIDVAVAVRGRRDVAITIADTGPGIDAESRAAIFLPYVRSGATGGVGLGLATVKRLVQSHGGTIQVNAAPGGGSAFTVTLHRTRSWA